jgi:hypothetical protein
VSDQDPQPTPEGAPAAPAGTAAPEAADAGTPPEGTPDPLIAAEADPEARVRAANREAAKYRTQLREAEAKLKAAEDEKLSELERAQKRAADAEQRLADVEQERARDQRRHAIITAAAEQNAIDPEAVYALVALHDDGSDAPDAVKAILADRPHLVKRASSGAGATPDAGRTGDTGGTTDDFWRGELYGGARGMFDAATAKERGGGVILDKAKIEASLRQP